MKGITSDDISRAKEMDIAKVLAGLGIQGSGSNVSPVAQAGSAANALIGFADGTIPPKGLGVFDLPGSLRPELGGSASPISPLDIPKFQQDVIKELVKTIQPLMKDFVITPAQAAVKPS